MAHLRNELDPALANPLRFSLVASLSNVVDMTFQELRDHLDTSDSTLSKHSSALEEAGYIRIKKGFVGKTPQTRLSITKPASRPSPTISTPSTASPKVAKHSSIKHPPRFYRGGCPLFQGLDRSPPTSEPASTPKAPARATMLTKAMLRSPRSTELT